VREAVEGRRPGAALGRRVHDAPVDADVLPEVAVATHGAVLPAELTERVEEGREVAALRGVAPHEAQIEDGPLMLRAVLPGDDREPGREVTEGGGHAVLIGREVVRRPEEVRGLRRPLHLAGDAAVDLDVAEAPGE